jgi:hypothetical protein
MVRYGGAVDVATEVFEHPLVALNRFPAVNDPTFLAGDVGESHIRRGSPSQPHEPSPKQTRKFLRRHEESLVGPPKFMTLLPLTAR